MNRPHFSRKERARIFALHEGVCYLCAGKINACEAWDIEHEIPWEISRDNTDANLRLAHRKCHVVKSRADAKDIAKVHRIAAKHNGTAPKTRTPLRSRGFAKSRLWPASGNDDSHDNTD